MVRKMKTSELIRLLSEMDEDARVVFVCGDNSYDVSDIYDEFNYTDNESQVVIELEN